MYISNGEAPRLSAAAAAGPAGALLLRSDTSLAFAMHEASLVAVLTERHRVQLTSGPGASFARSLAEAARGAERTEVAVRVSHADGTQVEARALGKAPFDFPGATADDIIDVYIRQTFAVAQALPIWSLARSVPIKELRWQVSTAPDVQLRLAAGNGLERRDGDLAHPDAHTWTLQLKDVPALVPAPLQPGNTRRGPWLVVVPVTAPNGSGVGSTWDQVAGWAQQHLASASVIDRRYAP